MSNMADTVVITRDPAEGGGEDRISLRDLLLEAGYGGTFDVSLMKPTEDDYILVRHLEDIDITPDLNKIS